MAPRGNRAGLYREWDSESESESLHSGGSLSRHPDEHTTHTRLISSGKKLDSVGKAGRAETSKSNGLPIYPLDSSRLLQG